ncbi:aldehyde dehydrogenase [Mycena vitilis]|nr:aldehyde dehydrogenase [Mycena vitilis]
MLTTPISEIPTIRETLRASFKKGVPRPLEWRKNQLLQLARMVQDNADAFSEALTKDLGKPRLEAYAHEIGPVIARCLLTVRQLDDWAKPILVDSLDWQKPLKATVHKAAKGVVLIISPWNYPLTLTLQPLQGAIAAGCCAVVKPSETSPHYSELIAELFPRYMDPSAYRIVLGEVAETTKLLDLQFFYTGNSSIARIICAAAAKHLTPLTLELGGKSPVIIDPSFDLNLAAKRILWAKAQNCGQFCVSPDYVLIPRVHQDEFISALKQWYAEFFPGGSLNSSSISRIVSPEHHARLTDLLKRSKGAVVLGGQTEGNTKIEVTVLKNVLADDALMDGEIFGPILPILPVDNVQDAIDFVRQRDHPLVLYAFTEIPEIKKQVLEETMSGSISFNDLVHQLACDELPFGGVGESGYGRQILKHSFDAFSYERASVDVPKECVTPASLTLILPFEPCDRIEPLNTARYPPYNDEKFAHVSEAARMQIPVESREPDSV